MLFTIEFARLFLRFQLKYLIFYDKYYLFEKIRLKPFFGLNSVCVSLIIYGFMDQF